MVPVSVFGQPKTKKVLIEGEGMPIIMLNGGTADMAVFAPHSKQLSAAYKILRMEHFNVQYATEGRMLPDRYSVQMESEGIKSTLDSLNIQEPIVLVGHSYGGLIALDFALNFQKDILSLVLIEPPVFSIAEAHNASPGGMKEMQELLQQLSPRANITDDLVKAFRCALMNCDTFDIRQHPLWTTWLKQKDRLRGLSVINQYKVNLEELQLFQKPVFIITGTQTVPFHKKIDELLAAALPLAKTAGIAGGHTVVNTNTAEFIQQLKSFLSDKN